jgi:hypothetical protein
MKHNQQFTVPAALPINRDDTPALAHTLRRLLTDSKWTISRLFKYPKETHGNVARPFCLFYTLRGFRPWEVVWYRKQHHSLKRCVSERARIGSLGKINGPYSSIIQNKLIFNELLQIHDLPHAEVFGAAIDGQWYWKNTGYERLQEYIQTWPVVIKPICGSGGKGNRFIKKLADWPATLPEDAIATKFLRNAAYARNIYPDALNTIRVTAFRDDDRGVQIPQAMHRFGNAGHIIDNFSSGGVVAEVDVRRGRLARAFYVTEENRVVETSVHPGTGAKIEGVRIDGWSEVLAVVERAMEELPFMKYVGWDIAVCDTGVQIVEANPHQDLNFFQLYRPLLDDSRFGRFLKAHLKS